MENDKTNIYQAVTELSFAIANIETKLLPEKMLVIRQLIEEAFGGKDEKLKAQLDLLTKNQVYSDLESIYRYTLFTLEKYKAILSEELIQNILSLAEKVAAIDGLTKEEGTILYRLEIDINEIINKKPVNEDLLLNQKQFNLYSAIGQLAYAIALADHVVLEDEKEAFKKVIHENLGDLDWLAQERFKVIDELTILDVESTYEHAIYMIEKNINALDEAMIHKFLNVITKVAEVAGTTVEETEILERFKKDTERLLEKKGK